MTPALLRARRRTQWALTLSTLAMLVSACALLRASTPAEAAEAAIIDARQANEVAARSCALYRAGVLLGEVPEDAGVTRSCDEAFP